MAGGDPQLVCVEIDLAEGRARLGAGFAEELGLALDGRTELDLARLGAVALTRIAPADHARARAALADALSAGGNGRIALESSTIDGAARRIECAWTVSRDAAGVPSSAFVACTAATAADPSRHAQIEEALRFERERLALALNAGQMGAFDLDIPSDTLWWSPQMYRIFGVAPESFTPTRESVLALVHPDDRELFVRRRAQAMQQHVLLEVEFRSVRPDGRQTWIGHRGRTVHDADGRPLRSFGITMDITAQKLAEQALVDADRQKDAFIATLAHELRNPLAPIRHAVELLGRRGGADPQVAWSREVIERQVAQMSHLVDDLLDVSRLTRGQVQLRRRTLRFTAVVEQAIEIAQPLVHALGHALEIALPDDGVAVDGDLTRLAQVFSNLLINAAKYTPAGGAIRFEACVSGAEIVARVIDDGIGIAADHLPHVFDMFGQAAAALDRAQGGLGIGLALAKGLVEMHGGSIEARSAGVGHGSEFTVRLPLSRRDVAEERRGIDEPAPPEGRALRILVADDRPDITESLAALLASMGHSVKTAADGEQAVAVAEAFRPDVVVLDLGMPRLNGYEACQRIRARPWGREPMLIAQTGWAQDEDRRRTREAGFDHHLVKPFEPAELFALLRSR
jgi:PAS domain S-box-containing protein